MQIIENSPSATGNSGATEVTLAAATAQEKAVAYGQDAVVGIASTSSFNIRFGPASLTAATDTGTFPAGTYYFRLRGLQAAFSFCPNANGKMLFWRASR